jgi:hypothetical protein
MGAGMSGQVLVLPSDLPNGTASAADPSKPATLETMAFAPGLAPWVAGRIGIKGSNEAGLTYAGRAIRLDGRHAFPLGEKTALSVGLGGSGIIASQPGGEPDNRSVYGGGLDIPVLIGYTSTADLYSFWAGPRGGFEILSGGLLNAPNPGAPVVEEEVGARHVYVGFVAGLRVGFRHVHVALELDGAYHFADGEIGALSMTIDQFTLTPSGALIISF